MGRKPKNYNNLTQAVEVVEQEETHAVEVVELIGLQTIIGTGKYSLKLGVEKQGVNPKIAKMLIEKGAATLKD